MPLNEQGRAESRQLGAHLAARYDTDIVHHSDLLRSVQTVDIVLDSVSVPDQSRHEEGRLRERNLGILQGIGPELMDEHIQYFLPGGGAVAVENRPENGESYLDLRDRVLEWWQSTLDTLESVGLDTTLLVVTHGGVVVVILAHLLELDLVDAFEAVDHDNCAINRVEYNGEEVQVAAQNETWFLDR